MKKRKTKAQREAEQKAALRLRVRDIASGAQGAEYDLEEEFATAEFLSRFLPALRATFDPGPEPVHPWVWGLHNLEQWDTVGTTTEFLWRAGYRA